MWKTEFEAKSDHWGSAGVVWLMQRRTTRFWPKAGYWVSEPTQLKAGKKETGRSTKSNVCGPVKYSHNLGVKMQVHIKTLDDFLRISLVWCLTTNCYFLVHKVLEDEYDWKCASHSIKGNTAVHVAALMFCRNELLTDFWKPKAVFCEKENRGAWDKNTNCFNLGEYVYMQVKLLCVYQPSEFKPVWPIPKL